MNPLRCWRAPWWREAPVERVRAQINKPADAKLAEAFVAAASAGLTNGDETDKTAFQALPAEEQRRRLKAVADDRKTDGDVQKLERYLPNLRAIR